MEREKKMDVITGAVCEYFSFDREQLLQPCRKDMQPVVKHFACYLMRKTTKLTEAEIAKYLNYKNHSSVSHAVKRMDELLDFDADLRNQLFELYKVLEVRGLTAKKDSEIPKSLRNNWYVYIDMDDYVTATNGSKAAVFVNHSREEIETALGENHSQWEIIEHKKTSKFLFKRKAPRKSKKEKPKTKKIIR